MGVRELIDYLMQFDDKGRISLVIADPDQDVRKVYPVKGIHPLAKDEDVREPCFIITVGKPDPLD